MSEETQVVEPEVVNQAPLTDADRLSKAQALLEADEGASTEGQEGTEASEAEETPAEEAPAEVESPGVAEALAKIAKSEARSRARIQEMEEAIQAKQTELQSKEKKLEEYFEVFKEFDTDPEVAIEAISKVMGKKTAPEDPRIAALEKKIEDMQASTVEQARSREIQGQVQTYVSEVKNLLGTEDSYKLLKAEAKASGQEPVEMVRHYAGQVMQQTGEIVSPEHVCKLIEDNLTQRLEAYREAGFISQSVEEAPVETQVRPGAQAQSSVTLTNRTAAQVASLSEADDFSDEARLKRAIALADKLDL